MIEVLYFEGCPHFSPTLEMVREVATTLDAQAEICPVKIRGGSDAERLRFIGSPTVRVDGADLEPDADSGADYALGCRLYGGSGVPPREMVMAAVRAANTNWRRIP